MRLRLPLTSWLLELSAMCLVCLNHDWSDDKSMIGCTAAVRDSSSDGNSNLCFRPVGTAASGLCWVLLHYFGVFHKLIVRKSSHSTSCPLLMGGTEQETGTTVAGSPFGNETLDIVGGYCCYVSYVLFFLVLLGAVCMQY